MFRSRFCLPAALLGAAVLTPVTARDDATPRPYEGHRQVRVELQNAQQVKLMETISPDCWCEGVRVGVLDFRVPPENMEALRRSGLRFEVITETLQPRFDAEAARIERHNRQDGGDWYGDFKNPDQILTRLTSFAIAYPDLAELIDIGDTIEGRDIWALRITAGNGDKPAILFNSCQHAREWISPMTTMYVAESLLSGYGESDRITALVNGTEFFIIPIVNPDGYRYTWNSYRMWRKNRRHNGNGVYGVDLNRNGGVGWGGGGSSGNPDSNIYRGTGPFSEPETQAMRDFYEAHRNITASIDFHSYGEYVLYPWAYRSGGPDDDGDHAFLSGAMVDAIYDEYGVAYLAGPVFETLYQASGASVDWTWGDQDVFSWTIELRGPGFDPPPSTIRPTVEENLQASLILAELAGGTAVEGDMNGDGLVNIDDILLILAAWGPCDGCPEDVDGNNVVDFSDLLVVLRNWTGG